MSAFEPALEVVLQHEGGFVHDPRDHGGATNMGITLRLFREWAGDHKTVEDLRRLSRDDAAAIYRAEWWDRYAYDRITAQACATKILDASVHMGPRRGHRLAQLAASRCGHTRLIVDGRLGPASVDAINACDPDRWLRALCAEQADFYRRLIAGDPVMACFRNGWLRRAAWPFDAAAIAVA